jgi:acylphosphatase
MAEELRIHVTVSGRVQNVGFRAFVLFRATELGVRCTVANRPDGSVECVSEGTRTQMDLLIQSLHEGPRSARVDSVDVVEQPARGDLPSPRMTA